MFFRQNCKKMMKLVQKVKMSKVIFKDLKFKMSMQIHSFDTLDHPKIVEKYHW